jgi:hypothetical protein
MEVHGKQVGAMTARFAHEHHHAVVFGDDEAVFAPEAGGGVNDHRHSPVRRTEPAAAVNNVIGYLSKGNADAVHNPLRSGAFLGVGFKSITKLVLNYTSVGGGPADSPTSPDGERAIPSGTAIVVKLSPPSSIKAMLPTLRRVARGHLPSCRS